MTTDTTTQPEQLLAVDVPAPTPAGCQRNAWCVRGFGHAGRCSRRTVEQIRADPKDNAGRRARGRPRKAAAAEPSRAPARRAKPRSTMKPLIGLLWSGIGQGLEAYGPEPGAPPAGRIMQFQAPYAAERLHPVLRTVPLYRRLDDATGGLFDDLGPLVLAPILGAVIASNESARAMLLPLLLSQLEPVAVEMARHQREVAQTVRELDGLSAEVETLMAGLVEQLFAPRVVDEQEAESYGPTAAFVS